MNFKDLVTQRFSARKYTNETVSQKELDYILECARLAPSAVNKQPWPNFNISSIKLPCNSGPSFFSHCSWGLQIFQIR